MKQETLRFENEAGLQLVGILLQPDGVVRPPVVVFAHGWGSIKASPRNRAIGEALVRAGIAAFLFDFTGHGESEGDAEASTLEDQAADLSSALELLTARADSGPLGLAGSSSGGGGDRRRGARPAGESPGAPCTERRLAAQARGAHRRADARRAGERDSLSERNRARRGTPLRASAVQRVRRRTSLRRAGTFDVALRETVTWFGQHLAGARQNAAASATTCVDGRSPRRRRRISATARRRGICSRASSST
jgi:dienelactone hydrolase